MAVITWNQGTPEIKTTSYEGLVIATYVREGKVMSDVYDNFYYALVWDVEAKKSKEVTVAIAGNYTGFMITPDAPRHILDAYDTEQSIREKRILLQRAKAAVERSYEYARDRHNEPIFDKKMVVVRSYKAVKKGMTGICFWVKNNRVGLRTPESKKVNGQWTDVIWCQWSQLANAEEFIHEADETTTHHIQRILELKADIDASCATLAALCAV